MKCKTKITKVNATFDIEGIDLDLEHQMYSEIVVIEETDGERAEYQSHPIEITISDKSVEQRNSGQGVDITGLRLSIASTEGLIRILQDCVVEAKKFAK